VADNDRFYTEEKVNKAFQTLNIEEENLRVPQLTHRLQQIFKASTTTDDSYHKGENARQTAGGQPPCIMKIARELADLKRSLPAGSISDYAQKPRFFDAMESRLSRNVELQLTPQENWDRMVAVAERYDSTMYTTGGYKCSDGSQASSSKPHTPKKENMYRKPPTTSIPWNTGK